MPNRLAAHDSPRSQRSSPRMKPVRRTRSGTLAEGKRLLAANTDGYALDEDEINNAGCLLLMSDHASESLGLLRWNTERFPKSANTWDSLAWAYYFLGDRLRAVENFEEDVRLDPKNLLAAQLLEELTAQLP
jgi:tetratricopeptide (TPR) repeat protein